jgi:hypothetical protein
MYRATVHTPAVTPSEAITPSSNVPVSHSSQFVVLLTLLEKVAFVLQALFVSFYLILSNKAYYLVYAFLLI